MRSGCFGSVEGSSPIPEKRSSLSRKSKVTKARQAAPKEESEEEDDTYDDSTDDESESGDVQVRALAHVE